MLRRWMWVIVIGLGLGRVDAQPDPQDNYINDFAGIISDDVRGDLRQQLADLEADHDIELTVVTVENYTGETYATDLFNQWGIGDVLLLVVVEPRQVRIELAEDYHGEYNGRMGIVIQEHIVPAFRDGDFERGITDGVNAIIRELVPPAATESSDRNNQMMVVLAAAAALVLAVPALLVMRKGGMKCPTCGKRLAAVVDDEEVKKLLTRTQRLEQKAHNAYYQVWVCPKGHVMTETPKAIRYAPGCPECGAKTYGDGGARTVREPTDSEPGRRERYKVCGSCGYRNVEVETVPRLKTAAEIERDERQRREEAERRQREAAEQRRREEAARREREDHEWRDGRARNPSFDASDIGSGGTISFGGGGPDFDGGSSDGDGADGDW